MPYITSIPKRPMPSTECSRQVPASLITRCQAAKPGDEKLLATPVKTDIINLLGGRSAAWPERSERKRRRKSTVFLTAIAPSSRDRCEDIVHRNKAHCFGSRLCELHGSHRTRRMINVTPGTT